MGGTLANLFLGATVARDTTSIQQKERPVKILETAVYEQELAVPTLPDRAGVSKMGTTNVRAMTVPLYQRPKSNE